MNKNQNPSMPFETPTKKEPGVVSAVNQFHQQLASGFVLIEPQPDTAWILRPPSPDTELFRAKRDDAFGRACAAFAATEPPPPPKTAHERVNDCAAFAPIEPPPPHERGNVFDARGSPLATKRRALADADEASPRDAKRARRAIVTPPPPGPDVALIAASTTPDDPHALLIDLLWGNPHEA